MKWPDHRSPAAVPEEDVRVEVRAGVDTDGDGLADTVVTEDGDELALHTDLDGDGFADQVLGIGGDGVVRVVAPPYPENGGSGDVGFGDMLGGLLDRLFGPRSPGAGVDP